MPSDLDQETQRLVESASKYVETADRVAMEEALLKEPEFTAYVIPASCYYHPETEVHVQPRYRKAALCGMCIEQGYRRPVELVEPDTRGVPVVSTIPHPVRIWPDDGEELPEHLAPEVTSRDPMPESVKIPGAVLKMRDWIAARGWEAGITYAKGNPIHGTTGKPLAVKESFAVRAAFGGFRVVAVHMGGSWGSMWGQRHMIQLRTVEELRAYVTACGTGIADEMVTRLRADHRKADAQKAREVSCKDDKVHDGHEWENANGALKWCKGRTKNKVTKQKDNGG